VIVVRSLLSTQNVMPSSKACTFVRRSLMAVLVAAVVVPATWLANSHGTVVKSSEASPTVTSHRDSTLTGKIAAPDPIAVIAPVGGAIDTVAVDEGTVVKEGEVLAVLAHDDTKLLAPVSGVVLRRSVNRGSVVRPDGAAPFLIVPNTPPQLIVEVDRATSRSLRAKSVATFTVTPEKRSFKARFSALRTESNPKGSLRYLASFSTEGSGAKVQPGMSVAVELER
jgi:multidrug efflux pump subunit AcrA (membrane-fusion protein)